MLWRELNQFYINKSDMEKLEVKECHKYLLDLAKELHTICVRNNIPYYMLGGTQLGAIRHKGFIPWDDDMDFGVPRKYYKPLMDLLCKELPSYYKVISIYNSDTYTNGFFKIEDTRTLIKEMNSKGMKNGVNIDVFPLDYTNNKTGKFSKNWWIVQLYKLETYCFSELEDMGWLRMKVNKILRLFVFFANNKTIFNFIDKHLIVCDGDYMVNHYGVYAAKEVMRKEIFGSPTLYPFEDTELLGIERYDEYLSHVYGNYMQMPKGKANHFHIQELYIK